MKRTTALFAALALLLALSCQAMAAVQSFHSRLKDFAVDVPDGWQAEAIADGCQVGRADGKSVMTIQAVPADARSAKDVAMAAAKAAKAEIKNENVEEEGAYLECQVNGYPLGILVVKQDGVLLSVVMAGEDTKTMEQIFDSLDTAKGEDGAGSSQNAGSRQGAGASSLAGALAHVAGGRDKPEAKNVQEFGAAGHRFTMAVPEGWQVKTDEDTVYLHDPKGELRCFVTSDENPGGSADELAEGTAKAAQITGISFVEKSPGRARVRGLHKGETDVSVLIRLDGRHALVVTIIEPEDANVKAAVASLAFVK